jgi:hypothetical protein
MFFFFVKLAEQTNQGTDTLGGRATVSGQIKSSWTLGGLFGLWTWGSGLDVPSSFLTQEVRLGVNGAREQSHKSGSPKAQKKRKEIPSHMKPESAKDTFQKKL